MWRPLSFRAQKMGNPGQKLLKIQHWILQHLSQKCPHSPMVFEDGEPFTLEEQDVRPAQCTCHTDTLSQCTNTHSPVDKLYHLVVIILSVFWQENSRIYQSLALFLWRHTVTEMQISRRKKCQNIGSILMLKEQYKQSEGKWVFCAKLFTQDRLLSDCFANYRILKLLRRLNRY